MASTEALENAIGDTVNDYLIRALAPWRNYMAVEDVNAITDGISEALHNAGIELVSREKIAAHLLTHVGGDEADPWQAGHNYAMTEAARLVRERCDLLTSDVTPERVED